MGLDQTALNGLRARDEKRAAMLQNVGGGRIGKTGRETMRIPQEAFLNAVEVNGGVQADGSTVWDDPGFVRDMSARYPHIVAPGSGRIFVGGRGDGRGVVRNRFGRVRERIRYVNGRKLVETF